MIQKFLEIKIETNGQNLINISQEIEKFVENSSDSISYEIYEKDCISL